MAKGQDFEREICTELSIWFSRGIRDDIFWRTAGSGARATQRAKKGKTTSNSYADVTSTHPYGNALLEKFVISIKRGYTAKKNKKSLSCLSILDMIDKPDKFKTKPLLVNWWEEINRDIENSKSPYKEGLIICRRDRRLNLIIMSRKTFLEIRKQKPCIYPPYNSGCNLFAFGIDVQIMLLNHFFYWCDPELLGAKKFIRKFGQKPFESWIKPGPYPSLTKSYFDELKKAVNII
ncbi:MAG: hypothetical protein BV456_06495 [Thermoplasmata archaeon M8B2D]|nr:MAG: hypothetical protein BV456_06495 [Thermoplasmata archaeon M8B2D]